MRRNLGALLPLALLIAAAACVNPDAGPTVLSGRAGLVVGLDAVGRNLPGSAAGTLVTGTLTGGANDSMRITLANLPQLVTGASYQVWLVRHDADPTAIQMQRISAQHQLQRPDTVGRDPITDLPIVQWVNVGQPEVAPTFTGPAGYRHILVVRAAHAVAAGVALPTFTHVVVTLGAGADASPQNSPAPVWYRYRTGPTTYQLNQPARFAFNAKPAWMNTVWTVFGAGNVEFLNTWGFGLLTERGSRPPLGFYFEVWLVDERGTHAPLNLGPVTSPPPVFRSLIDADVEVIENVVTELELVRSVRWVEWADLPAGNTFDKFSHVRVMLRSKQADTNVFPATVLYEAQIPNNLDRLPTEKEHRIRDTR